MPQGIQCIVGLGNPGGKYESTRHNAGYWFVEELARRHCAQFRADSKLFGETCRISVAGEQCWLLKPTTFMNRSGQSVSAMARFYRIDPQRILIAHDELDLPAGIVRLKKGGGHGGHNGLRDTIKALGTPDFYRLRIGIDHPGHRDHVFDYVLSPPRKEEATLIMSAIERAADQLPDLLSGDFQRVMNSLHSR
ncbi:MAG: aminoacyl-tRNA hydrolase [Gammaproteobacteria bacterium]|nr:MAG: aminoacyl-tRNA hydrolase [Gammaproteobacteria bacterium]